MTALLSEVLPGVPKAKWIKWVPGDGEPTKYVIMFHDGLYTSESERACAYLLKHEHIAAAEGIGRSSITVTRTNDGGADVLSWLQVTLQPERAHTGGIQVFTRANPVIGHITLLGTVDRALRDLYVTNMALVPGVTSGRLLEDGTIEVVFEGEAPTNVASQIKFAGPLTADLTTTLTFYFDHESEPPTEG